MLDARETGANRTGTPTSGASSETVNQGPCEGLIGLLEPCAVKVASTVLIAVFVRVFGLLRHRIIRADLSVVGIPYGHAKTALGEGVAAMSPPYPTT